jgi:hypothetical protein
MFKHKTLHRKISLKTNISEKIEVLPYFFGWFNLETIFSGFTSMAYRLCMSKVTQTGYHGFDSAKSKRKTEWIKRGLFHNSKMWMNFSEVLLQKVYF